MALLTRLLIFGVVFYQGGNTFCILEDSECLTKGAQKTYQNCVAGDLKGVPSSDPLHVDLVEGNLQTVNYKVRNATLHGMRTCNPELVKIEPNDTIFFNYHVACRHLNMDGQYLIKGKLGTSHIEEQGDFIVEYYDNVFLFSGTLEQSFDENNKLHMQIKTFDLDINVRGNVTYNFKIFSNGDTEKFSLSAAALHEYTAAHEKETNESLRKPVMEKFMALFIKNVNSYLKVVPIEDVFF